jgi:hypothetical protein
VSFETPTAPTPKWMFWTGCVLSALPVLMLLMSATFKFLQPPQVTEGMAKFGYPESVLLPLGVVELTATVLYVIPQTSVLGAIILTGYLGGATATHVRVGDAFYMPIILGVLLWLGLYFRDARIRALVPWRR